jgi:nucleotide-binding universal stress UspA family protein
MKSRSRVTRREFRVLVATDGSLPAQRALRTALVFPWPRGTRVLGAMASPPCSPRGRPERVRVALARSVDHLTASARQALARRWPEAEVRTADMPAVEGILREAARFSADVTVLGWRGHGVFRRLVMGSVSRGVVRHASTSVLVVRRRMREIRRIVIGVDGSPNSRRAVELAASFDPVHGGEVTVVHVVEPMQPPPSSGRLPASIQAMLRHEVAAVNGRRMRDGKRELERAAVRLRGAGWRVRTEQRMGAPLAELLAAIQRGRSQLLMVGARAVSGVERAFLGSVAEGALNRSPVPVLVVRGRSGSRSTTAARSAWRAARRQRSQPA